MRIHIVRNISSRDYKISRYFLHTHKKREEKRFCKNIMFASFSSSIPHFEDKRFIKSFQNCHLLIAYANHVPKSNLQVTSSK